MSSSNVYRIRAIFCLKKAERIMICSAFLVRRPVFAFLFVLQHAEIGCVARFTDVVLFYGFAHSTSRLVAVCAVIVFAICRSLEYFREVVPYFLFLHVEGTKTFDARCVDDIAVARHGKHFRESGCVHPLVVVSRYCGGFDFLTR